MNQAASYISVALLPNQADSSELVTCSESLSKATKSAIVLGPHALPHLTVTRFAVAESAIEELRTDLHKLSTKITTLLSGGLRFTPDPVEDRTWVDVQFLKPATLDVLQAEIASIPFAQKHRIHNKQGDVYAPHCTLALLEGKKVPAMDISSFDLFRRPFTELQLAVGVNGDNLTLLSAEAL